MIEIEIEDYGSPWMAQRGDMFLCEGTLHIVLSECKSGMTEDGNSAYHMESLIFCEGNEKPLYFKGIISRDKIRKVKDLSIQVVCT